MALALAWMIPNGAWAADLYLSASVALEYDSNVLRREDDVEDDIVFRGSPRLELREDDGNFTYSLAYQVPYERGFSESDVDEFSHFALAQFGYVWGGKNNVLLRNNFRYQDGTNNSSLDGEDDVDVVRVNEEDFAVLRNDLTLSYDRSLTPRLTASVLLANSLFETEQDSRSDNRTYGGRASLSYDLTSRHQIGAGLGAQRQEFDQAEGRSGSEANYFNIFGLWSWQIDSTTRFEIRGGPTLIDNTQDSPPTSTVTSAFPFVSLGSDTLVSNFFDSSGTFHAVETLVPAGSVAVSDFNSCPVLPTGGDTVIIGNTCGTLGVLFSDNPADTANINTVTTSQNTLFFPGGNTPGSKDDSTITFFGNVSLTKHWTSVLSSSLRYERRGSTASGLSGATTLDSLSLANFWDLSELWTFDLRGDWTQRQSISDSIQTFIAVQPDAGGSFTFGFPVAESSGLTSRLVDDDIDTQRWGFAARLSRALGRNATASVRYSYNQQSSEGRTRGSSSDFENHIVSFGYQYNFDPIRAW